MFTIPLQLIYQLESRKYEAVSLERFDNARKLKDAMEALEAVGLVLGAMEMQKKILVQKLDYEGAKGKKSEMDGIRDEAYRRLAIAELLELPSPSARRKAAVPPPHRGENLPPVVYAAASRTRRSSSSSSEQEVKDKQHSLSN